MNDIRDIILATVYLLAAITVVIAGFYVLTIAVPVAIALAVVYMMVQIIKEDRED